eukprot:scaffold108097_cov50-Prasinocladus_malaysianus.AAC.2
MVRCIGTAPGDVGLIQDKEFTTKAQRFSLWGWCLTSLSTALMEAYQCAQLAGERRTDEDEQ